MEEEWRDIRDYPGYQVSNLGRVRSKDRVTYANNGKVFHWRDKIMKRSTNKDTYFVVSLSNGGVSRLVTVHRLVAIAFVENPLNLPQVNHKDGNKQNNRPKNLEWVTAKGNTAHAIETGLWSKNKKCSLINEIGEEYTFRSEISASYFLGRYKAYISECVRYGRPISDKRGNQYEIRFHEREEM